MRDGEVGFCICTDGCKALSGERYVRFGVATEVLGAGDAGYGRRHFRGSGDPGGCLHLRPPRASERLREWRPLGSPTKVDVGTPTLFKTRVERTSGWVTQEEEVSLYVFTEDGQNFTGLSNVCTHLGCRVRWVGDQDTFFCPCHNATFSKDGRVTSGPPPRPLDTFDVKVEDGQLFVSVEV